MIYKVEDYVQEDTASEKYPVKQIQAMTPITGSEAKFIGRMSLGLQTPMGVQHIPVTFEIEAGNVEEAFGQFESAAEPAIENTRKELEEQIDKVRREQSSRIIRPDEVAGGGLMDLQDFRKK